MLLFHVTVYLFSALFNLNIYLYINLCCHLLIRLIILIYFPCTYNRFNRFIIYFVVCRYILLTNPCYLPIHATWISWNVIYGMCLVLTRTSIAAVFFFFFFTFSLSLNKWNSNPLITAVLFFGTWLILTDVQSKVIYISHWY